MVYPSNTKSTRNAILLVRLMFLKWVSLRIMRNAVALSAVTPRNGKQLSVVWLVGSISRTITRPCTLEFMESIWWVFKTLFEKGQIYRKYRVMPFSTACNTPLSNFEVALNYKDVQDPSLTLTCPLRNLPEGSAFTGASFLVWTTTPWTLPSNLAFGCQSRP